MHVLSALAMCSTLEKAQVDCFSCFRTVVHHTLRSMSPGRIHVLEDITHSLERRFSHHFLFFHVFLDLGSQSEAFPAPCIQGYVLTDFLAERTPSCNEKQLFFYWPRGTDTRCTDAHYRHATVKNKKYLVQTQL